MLVLRAATTQTTVAATLWPNPNVIKIILWFILCAQWRLSATMGKYFISFCGDSEWMVESIFPLSSYANAM